MYTVVFQSACRRTLRRESQGIKCLQPEKRSSGCFNHGSSFPEHSFASKLLQKVEQFPKRVNRPWGDFVLAANCLMSQIKAPEKRSECEEHKIELTMPENLEKQRLRRMGTSFEPCGALTAFANLFDRERIPKSESLIMFIRLFFSAIVSSLLWLLSSATMALF